ncbi:MAG: tRNA (5-methylaminomethyl-2-thiouridine)(34)-methyltransferase MnmD [Flavobacteriales bacterium]|nr:tRNA (5-methylaminomethyl-2-thiouridine)(34)-methyltransferase MnmD [Flavobacteriales bacterium]
MKRKIITTADGSQTLEVEELEETYHSRHGARQESEHVFIQMGLVPALVEKKELTILEVGFGTGLNAILSWKTAKQAGAKIHYIGLEAFPVTFDEVAPLGYAEGGEEAAFFQKLHEASWEEEVVIDEHFSITKHEVKLEDATLEQGVVDVVYYDAFGPRAQPEMWRLPLFEQLFEATNEGGIFVTYCAKGQVRRDLASAGYDMERIEGPPGKRHMLRGRK